jgi:rhamnosyltransferase
MASATLRTSWIRRCTGSRPTARSKRSWSIPARAIAQSELAAKAGAIVREIPPETFNHGLTRNLLAEQARGNYLVYLTQDATPANEHWLESLLRPLDAEILLAGVYGAHRPRPDCDPVTSYLIRQVWALAGETFPARTNVIANWQEYRANLGSYVYFANTSSAIRRSVWQEIPFREVSFAEDADWARRVLEAGYLTRFEPRSVVLHSHTYRIPDLLRRNFEHAQAFHEMFGPTDRRSLAQRLAEAIELKGVSASSFCVPWRCFLRKSWEPGWGRTPTWCRSGCAGGSSSSAH